MKRISSLILVILCSFLPISVTAADLTEAQVNHVIENVDNAINALDADRLANAFSSNVKISMTLHIQGQKQVLQFSKPEYIEMLKQGWQHHTNYQYKRSNLKIQIQGNKAAVSADITESMDINGQKLSGKSKEEVSIELIDGKPLITHVVGVVNM